MLEKDLVQQCKNAAEAMGAFLAVVGQRNARKSGSTLGVPDLILFCAGQVRLIELKRPNLGRLSLGQLAFIDRCAEQHVKVHVVDNVQDFADVVNGCRRRKEVG